MAFDAWQHTYLKVCLGSLVLSLFTRSAQLCFVKTSSFVGYAFSGYTQVFFSLLSLPSCKSILFVFFLALCLACWILRLASFQLCWPGEISAFLMTSNFFVAPQLKCKAKPRGTLRSRGNITHCFPWDQSLSVLLYLSTQGGTIHWCQLMTLLQNVTNPNNLHIK